MPRSIDFSRATASAICKSSSLLALTAAIGSVSFVVTSVNRLGGKALLLRPARLWIRPAVGLRVGFRYVIARVWRLEPEVLAQLAFGGLAASERLRDQRIGQHQARFADAVDREQHLGRFVRFGVVAAQPQGVAFNPDQ